MGKAEPELSHKLIGTYLQLLSDHQIHPAAICFYTEGVKLVTEGSPVIDILKALENQGVRLIACQTCLSYFGLLELLRVGIVGGMTDILDAQLKAQKVITI
jgi:intracellular sulfur oxidation DsrE/DsrF family protein